jgi:hypothetical protein
MSGLSRAFALPVILHRAALLPFAVLCLLSAGCHSAPRIVFTAIPSASKGGPGTEGTLTGRVSHFRPGQRIVIYTHTATKWWVQPLVENPYTTIHVDGSWSAPIHLGRDYAALLVARTYQPPGQLKSLPPLDNQILAEASAPATGPPPPAQVGAPDIHFSGYDWETRDVPGNNGGALHEYDPRNVWVDNQGAMHLRITRVHDKWVCAEAYTLRSFGYGAYSFHLRDIGHMDPAAMLSLNTWDDSEVEQNRRELDVHLSRFGNPDSKNAQYVVQPYFVPSNVYRFEMPPGPVTTSFRWLPGSAEFTTTGGPHNASIPDASWTFTTDVPTPGGETVYVSLCEFTYGKVSFQHETEVVLDSFQFLP